METYKNLGGDSGVKAYEIASNYILVKFTDNWVYKYTSNSVGMSNFSEMKRLATQGEGLNSFINTNEDVKKGYTDKYQA
jgi:hypothetical protein